MADEPPFICALCKQPTHDGAVCDQCVRVVAMALAHATDGDRDDAE